MMFKMLLYIFYWYFWQTVLIETRGQHVVIKSTAGMYVKLENLYVKLENLTLKLTIKGGRGSMDVDT